MKNKIAYMGLGILVLLAILDGSPRMLVSVLGMGLMFRLMRAAPLWKQLLATASGALLASLIAEVVYTLYHMIKSVPPGVGGDDGGFFVSATLVGLINAGAFVAFLLLLEWFMKPKIHE